MKVSIIMPVYNSEKYVKKAAESVLKQDFDGFELIMVDDGSTDDSGKVCDVLADEYKNVKVIHKTNGGICSARNAGLKVAEGEYVGFCDNDDEYLPGLIKDNYDLATAHDVDLMRYCRKRVVVLENGKKNESVTPIKEEQYLSFEEFGNNYYLARIADTIWSAIYKKKIIDENDIRFDESYKYGAEDGNFNLKYLACAKKLGFNPRCYYVWTQRNTRSTSRQFHKELIENVIDNVGLEYLFYTKTCNKEVDSFVRNKFLINTYVYWVIEYLGLKTCNLNNKEKADILEKFRNCNIFDDKLSASDKKRARQDSLRLYIIMKLFYERKYRRLMFVLSKGTAILEKFRFKK